MLETSGRLAGLIIGKKTRPTLGTGRPRNVATGCTRHGDLSNAGRLGAGEKAGPHRL